MTFEELPSVNFDDLDPKYVYNGKIVPRVTQIISRTINEEYIVQWANRLGLRGQKYNQTLEKAASYGTEAHDLIDVYLNNGFVYSYNIAFQSFKKWWDIIKINNPNIIFTEKALISPFFGGTCDLFIQINGRNYIVDYKTSNYMSYKYFLQLSAYKYMIENLGYLVNGVIILKLNKEYLGFDEFVLSFDNPEHANFMGMCHETFMAMVYSYYNVYRIKKEYDKLWTNSK